MPKYSIFFIVALLVFSLISPSYLYAAEDPLSVANNKFAIHILFDNELPEAAKLVNSNGGDWGYVTIPIQAGDEDLIKWQNFMDQAKALHVIPIIRLATEGDYFNSSSWRKPTLADVLDFANFLDSLDWPTKNRYVIIFNEVNRADEWGGAASPAEYAEILSYAADVFKSKSSDFFIISSGLDNAAPNDGNTYIDEYTFLRGMHEADPDVFKKIDGIASHSYPNPGFSQPPSNHMRKGIMSFSYEKKLADTYGEKDFPVFITETGWSADGIDDATRASYYKEALSNEWADQHIVAITPFLLKAGGGPFQKFSFLKDNGEETLQYQAYKDISKTRGQPLLGVKTLSIDRSRPIDTPSINFLTEKGSAEGELHPSVAAQTAFKWIMKLD